MESHKEPSTPPTPASSDSTVSDVKLSRKRERELSAEPVLPSKTAVDANLPNQELKESQVPAKKNKTRLATTIEEDAVPHTRSNSHSPPLSASPPQEMKIQVRQISQGVEDISWKNKEGPNQHAPVDVAVTSSVGASSVSPNGTEDTQGPLNEAGKQVLLAQATVPETCDPPGVTLSKPPSRCTSEPDIEENDLKSKPKEGETGPNGQENGHAEKSSPEVLKRPRDNADEDDNPRETKRPTPPPESERLEKTEKTDNVPKHGGFMAYASVTSPFGSVRGQNIFASRKSPSPFSSLNNQSNTFSSLPPVSSELSTSVGTKRTGFEAFASSSSSPFATSSAPSRARSPSAPGSPGKLNRNKSPPRRSNVTTSAFSSYVTSGSQSFTLPAQKRQRAESPGNSPRGSLDRRGSTGSLAHNDEGEQDESDHPATFGERLRAGKDEDANKGNENETQKVLLTEQDVATGEEEEETIHQVRGKLYALTDGSQWRERGSGLLKLNVKQADGSGARLVMRKDAVFTVLLNVTLFFGMSCFLAQDPRYLRFSTIEDGQTTHYNLRTANAKIAKELLEVIKANLPSA